MFRQEPKALWPSLGPLGLFCPAQRSIFPSLDDASAYFGWRLFKRQSRDLPQAPGDGAYFDCAPAYDNTRNVGEDNRLPADNKARHGAFLYGDCGPASDEPNNHCPVQDRSGSIHPKPENRRHQQEVSLPIGPEVEVWREWHDGAPEDQGGDCKRQRRKQDSR